MDNGFFCVFFYLVCDINMVVGFLYMKFFKLIDWFIELFIRIDIKSL